MHIPASDFCVLTDLLDLVRVVINLTCLEGYCSYQKLHNKRYRKVRVRQSGIVLASNWCKYLIDHSSGIVSPAAGELLNAFQPCLQLTDFVESLLLDSFQSPHSVREI